MGGREQGRAGGLACEFGLGETKGLEGFGDDFRWGGVADAFQAVRLLPRVEPFGGCTLRLVSLRLVSLRVVSLRVVPLRSASLRLGALRRLVGRLARGWRGRRGGWPERLGEFFGQDDGEAHRPGQLPEAGAEVGETMRRAVGPVQDLGLECRLLLFHRDDGLAIFQEPLENLAVMEIVLDPLIGVGGVQIGLGGDEEAHGT